MEQLNELALFAGAGGGILGGKLLGWRTVCAVEWESYPASVLCARQNDGFLPPFPIWDDVQTFDGHPWRGIVDVVSGGFPCQDISSAGKGAGIDGERSGMWREMARIIHEVRPRYAFVENSPMLTSRGLGVVLGDLASMGFDARWGVLGAADVGANHQRDRIWIVGKIANTESGRSCFASNKQKLESEGSDKLQPIKSRNTSKMAYTAKQRLQREQREKFEGYGNGFANKGKDVANTSEIRSFCKKAEQWMERKFRFAECSMDRNWWATEPTNVPRIIERDMGGMVNGLAARVDRLKAIGNGQVPLCAATAWRILNA